MVNKLEREVEILREILKIKEGYLEVALQIGRFNISPKDEARLAELRKELENL